MRRNSIAFIASAFLIVAGCAGKAPGSRNGAAKSKVDRAWTIMGTVFSVSIWAPSESEAKEGAEAAFRKVAEIDSLMSLYKSDSELSRVNAAAGKGVDIRLGEHTCKVIARAMEIAEMSEGRFNPAVGPLVDLWRMYEPWKGEEQPLPSVEAIAVRRALTRWRDVTLRTCDVKLPRKGMNLDLNGIAKGYALDVAAQAAHEKGEVSGLLDLGGQILVFGRNPDGEEWNIGIRDPHKLEEVQVTVDIDGGSVATSGDYERFFMHKGKKYSHIIDPVTGWPAEGSESVSVWAKNGMDADAWSTALFVAGPVEGKKLLLRQPGLGAVWLGDSGAPKVAGALIGHVEVP